MSRKKNWTSAPRRLTHYLMLQAGEGSKDGAEENGRSSSPPHSPAQPEQETPEVMAETAQDVSTLSSTDRGKRVALSPVHSPQKTPQAKKYHWATSAQPQADIAAVHTTPLAAFSASDAPTPETSLKAMLPSLQTGLQQELHSSISYLTNHIDSIEDHTYMFESQLGKVVKEHDELVDAHDKQMEAIHKLQLKVADFEARFYRNNIKPRGIPEVVKQNDLVTYLHLVATNSCKIGV